MGSFSRVRTSQFIWVFSTFLILFSVAASGLIALLSAFCIPALISIVRAACLLHGSSDEMNLLSSVEGSQEHQRETVVRSTDEEAMPLASEDANSK